MTCYNAVLSLVLVVMTILLLFAAQRFQGQQRLYRAGVGTAARTLHPCHWDAGACPRCSSAPAW
ncbi:MAG: hypothetical protein R2838_11560 [Caldilineaceae bacterium]